MVELSVESCLSCVSGYLKNIVGFVSVVVVEVADRNKKKIEFYEKIKFNATYWFVADDLSG